MEHFKKADREKIYREALGKYGFMAQAVVALEELSEVQKEICKTLRNKGNRQDLAEEIADACIMLEQIAMLCDVKQMVVDQVDTKLIRLKRRLKGEVE